MRGNPFAAESLCLKILRESSVEVGALAFGMFVADCIPYEQRLGTKLPVGNFLEYNANSANLFADAREFTFR